MKLVVSLKVNQLVTSLLVLWTIIINSGHAEKAGSTNMKARLVLETKLTRPLLFCIIQTKAPVSLSRFTLCENYSPGIPDIPYF